MIELEILSTNKFLIIFMFVLLRSLNFLGLRVASWFAFEIKLKCHNCHCHHQIRTRKLIVVVWFLKIQNQNRILSWKKCCCIGVRCVLVFLFHQLFVFVPNHLSLWLHEIQFWWVQNSILMSAKKISVWRLHCLLPPDVYTRFDKPISAHSLQVFY